MRYSAMKELYERIEEALGREVAALEPVRGGGYSLALRLKATLSDGGTAFVKAATTDDTARFLRAEKYIYESLGPQPFLAGYLGFHYEGGAHPLLVLEDLTGATWPPPWTTARVDAVLDALARLHALPPLDGLSTADIEHRDSLTSWRLVAESPAPFLALGICSEDWLEKSLSDLLLAESQLDLSGDALLHVDVRSDNLCFRADGSAILVDWNWAVVGNPAMDIAGWLPSLHAEGGPAPEALLPGAGTWAASLSGYFAAHAGLPPPEGAPTVRKVQLSQLKSALSWAVRELCLPPLDA